MVVIEDELSYLRLLHDQLTAKGYKVHETIDGKKGLELIKKENPDLVILDIRMPVMDGLTMLGILRKEEASKNTKVIMLTNLEPSEQMIGEVINDQPLYYFVKSDISLEDLFKKIEELLA